MLLAAAFAASPVVSSKRPFQEMLGDQQESRLLLTIAALCAFEKGLYHASHFRMGEGGFRFCQLGLDRLQNAGSRQQDISLCWGKPEVLQGLVLDPHVLDDDEGLVDQFCDFGRIVQNLFDLRRIVGFLLLRCLHFFRGPFDA